MIDAYRLGFRLGAELPVDQVGGLRDDHGRGDQGTLVALQQPPAGRVVPVSAIGRRDQRAGIDDQHLIAPEPLGQHLIGVSRAASGRRFACGGEGQPTARRLGQLRRKESRCQLICSLAIGTSTMPRLSCGNVPARVSAASSAAVSPHWPATFRNRTPPQCPARPTPSSVTFRPWSQPLCAMAKSAPVRGSQRVVTA
jgi:hypothetical protein